MKNQNENFLDEARNKSSSIVIMKTLMVSM